MVLNVFPLVIFALVICAVITCINIKVLIPLPKWKCCYWVCTQPSRRDRPYFHFDYVYIPIIGVICLLIGRTMSFEDVWVGGIVGDSDVQPYTIMILFISLAYVCMSLDSSGVLSFISILVVKLAGSSKKRLFVYFYILAGLMTTVTSNDIVVLTLSPVVAYCVKFTGGSPWPYLFAMFYAGNVFSLLFLVSNTTNVIVGEAFHISFGEYVKDMAAPMAVSSVIGGQLIYYIYRRDLEGTFTPPDLDPKSALLDPIGGIVHGCTVGGLLICMALTSFLFPDIRLWMIALSAAGISLIYNCIAYPFFQPPKKDGFSTLDTSEPGHDNLSVENQNHPDSNPHNRESLEMSPPKTHGDFDVERKQNPDESAIDIPIADYGSSMVELEMAVMGSIPSLADQTREQVKDDTGTNGDNKPQEKNKLTPVNDKSTISILGVLKKVPWDLLPFVFGMFCLVEGLVVSGWIHEMGNWVMSGMGGVEFLNRQSWASFIPALFMMLLATIVVNVMNNQPAAILLTRIMTSTPFKELHPSALRGAVYATIAATNVGALFTLIGALAGILFVQVLKNYDLQLTYFKFLKVGIVVGSIISIFCALVIALVLH